MKFNEWIKEKNIYLESNSSRYSVEVNYRTKTKDALKSYAKIVLGYVSAGLKQNDYHVKQVFEKDPIRVIISSRSWDDGEWVAMVHFNPEHEGGCFVISKGFYNKDKRTVSVQKSTKCSGDNASEITTELLNLMHQLKNTKDRHLEKLKPVKLKRGPK
jgi:hypothetical protein